MDGLDHPAVVAVIEQLGYGLEPLIVQVRDEAVAVVLADESILRTIIVERRGDDWPLPTMLGGGQRRPAPRPTVTIALDPFVEGGGWSGSGWPKPDGGRPDAAWHALTGLAAEDAVAVELVTALDQVQVPVRDDGRFVALVFAPWGDRPTVRVRTVDGDWMPVSM